LGHQVVTGRQMRLREDARHDLTGGIVSSAHSAAVQTLLRADDSVAADGLYFKKKIKIILSGSTGLI
jgi:hypothetical protein